MIHWFVEKRELLLKKVEAGESRGKMIHILIKIVSEFYLRKRIWEPVHWSVECIAELDMDEGGGKVIHIFIKSWP